MRILHISTFDRGGAGIAAIRLHEGLLKLGVESNILFKYKSREDIPKSYYIKEYKRGGGLLLKFSRRNKYKKLVEKRNSYYEGYSLHWGDDLIKGFPEISEYNIINLHWVAAGFLDFSFFKAVGLPLVWTLHDMNPFTGGCHYSWHCELFINTCKSCYQLEETGKPNISKYVLKEKNRKLNKLTSSLTVVAPSKWLTNCSKNSSLFQSFPHYTIPYGLDSSKYISTPINKARDILGLPQDKKILLFVSQMIDNHRKGIDYLVKALSLLKAKGVLVVAIGEKSTNYDALGVDVIITGTISETEKMSLYYSASDAFIISSLQDNLPNTVLESLMCGTPVIGFPVGGIPDMVKSGFNGIVSDLISSDSLAESIDYFLKHQIEYDRKAIRKDAINRYDILVQAKKYQQLYKGILSK